MSVFPFDPDCDVKTVFQADIFGPPHLLDLDLQKDLHAILTAEGYTLMTDADRPLEVNGEVGCVEILMKEHSVLDLLDAVRRNLPRGILVDCSVIVEMPTDDPFEMRYFDISVTREALPGLI